MKRETTCGGDRPHRWRCFGTDQAYVLFPFCILAFTPVAFLLDHKHDLGFQEQLLSSATEAAAGVIAIASAIFIIIMQHTASSYTPTLLKKYRNDSKFWFTFAFGLFTITFLSISIISELRFIVMNMFYFTSFLVLVGMLFLNMFKKIDPDSIVRDIRTEMIKDCLAIHRSDARKDGISMEDVLKDPRNKKRYNKIMHNELSLRQITIMSAKKGDYVTTKNCFNIYGIILEGYLKIIPGNYWTLDGFITKFLDALGLYWEHGIEHEKSILPDLINTYKNLGYVAIGNVGGVTVDPYTPNQPLSKCLDHLEKFGTKLALAEEHDLARDVIGCMEEIGFKACNSYRFDHRVTDRILEIANAVIRKKGYFFIPWISMMASLQITACMLQRGSEADHVREKISKLSSMLISLEISGISKTPIREEFRYQISEGITECVIFSLFSKTENGGTYHDAEHIRKGVIGMLVDLLGEFGMMAEKHGDRPMEEVSIQTLASIAWVVAPAELPEENANHMGELERILVWMYRFYCNGAPDANTISAEVAVIIAYCCTYWHEGAIARGMDLMCHMSQFTMGVKHKAQILALFDIIGCCMARQEKMQHCEKIAEYWLDLEKRYEAEHGNKPQYSALEYARLLIALYGKHKISLLSPKWSALLMTPEQILSDSVSADALGKFNSIKHAMQLRRHKADPAA